MPIGRYFCDTKLKPGQELLIEGQEHHHLAHVTRSKVGEMIEVVNGKGKLATGKITELQKRNATIQVMDVLEEAPKKSGIVLIQAIPRINRLDLIVEKCTELGMTELRLFPGDKGERVKLTTHQTARLRSIAIGAMKQSGRLYLPEITFHPPLCEWKAFPENSFFGDIEPSAKTLIEVWKESQQQGSCAIFIGPESGFSDDEVRILKECGVRGVALHNNILRTDTAAIASVAVLSILRL